MIEEMASLSLVTRSSQKGEVLEKLRALGIMHITTKKASEGEGLEGVNSEIALLCDAQKVLSDIASSDKGRKKASPSCASADFDISYKEENFDALGFATSVVASSNRLSQIKTEIQSNLSVLESYSRLGGEVSLQSLSSVLSSTGGKLCSFEPKLLKKSPGFDYLIVSSKARILLSLPKSPEESLPEGVTPLELPKMEAREVREAISTLKDEEKALNDSLLKATNSIALLDARIAELSKKAEFIGYSAGMENADGFCELEGWIPRSSVEEFKEAFKNSGSVAWIIDEPKGDDAPPTKLVFNRFTRFLSPVLALLGTLPGYYERDISSSFLAFFSLFVAMILGDAGYGLVVLLLGLFLCFKGKRLTDAAGLLVILGSLTLVWGAITGTWFGSSEILSHSQFLQSLVIPQIANFPFIFGIEDSVAQNTLIRFCFTLGAFQLILACLMNTVYKSRRHDLSCVSEIGWASSIFALYRISLYLVTGVPINFKSCVIMILVGFTLVVLFSAQGPNKTFLEGVKGGLGGMFTSFLNTISALGNIMSYIRLFAVGMASVAIGQSFNGIASGLLSGLLVPLGVMILLIGHSINFVMGILSVMVHGVRLNVMEYSSQLGLEWSGYKYEPFKE